jgi:hypothetical protein
LVVELPFLDGRTEPGVPFCGAQIPGDGRHSALFSITTKSLTIEPHEIITA